jgi:uncharacterized protein YeaO (DUF488 family)
MIRTKRIYEAPSPDDGHRLLVMRMWPRGIRKEAVDEWQPDLGPSRPLIADFRQGRIDWPQFTSRYQAEMAEKGELLARAREQAQQETITLLCSCADENRCHRTLLKRLLERF